MVNSYFSKNRSDILSLIKSSPSRFLDVGCACGYFASAVKLKYSCETWGIEPHKQACLCAKNKIDKVLNGNYDEVEYLLPDNYFNGISFNDSLEHMNYPDEVLRRVGSKLADGGEIYASIPNFLYFDNLWQILSNRDIRYVDSGILDKTHLRFFTRKSIIRLFDEAGYKIEQIVPIQLLNSWKWQVVVKIIGKYINDFTPLQYGIVAIRK